MTGHPQIPVPDRDDVQGWIVNGYNLPVVRQIALTVLDRGPVLQHLDAATAGSTHATQVQRATRWTEKPSAAINIGITSTGLAELGVGRSTIAQFPADFRHGPAKRASRLGDAGAGAPANWDAGMADVDQVHVLWTIHGESDEAIDMLWDELGDAFGAAVRIVQEYQGRHLPGGIVHFGFADGISQPRLAHLGRVTAVAETVPDPPVPLGAFFLGHESQFERVVFDVPEPAALTGNGTYNAFRVLEQDVFGFEDFLDDAAQQTGKDREWIAAKICGRWRNGNPLELAPDEAGDPLPRADQNDFLYSDRDGSVCPVGSHARRTNPRNTTIVQKNANHSKPLIRRGVPYGPLIEPGQERDGISRGLLGNFFCASIATQFEGVQNGWVNHGLIHPDITGTNDPLIGAQDPTTSRFRIPMPDGDDIELRGFGQFVHTRASAYTFMPSISGLRTLAGGR